MKPIQAALAEAHMLIDSGSRYVIIKVNSESDERIDMQIGAINSRGEREQVHGSISYFMFEDHLRSVVHPIV